MFTHIKYEQIMIDSCAPSILMGWLRLGLQDELQLMKTQDVKYLSMKERTEAEASDGRRMRLLRGWITVKLLRNT